MRELRVIGLTPDATHVVCADTETGQKFRLTVDEKLRAASRGDIARFGQIEIEMDSTMRPRDIQARIRAGASVEQVAAAAGMPADRVERFAYPVLLERSRAAELAKRGHPLLSDGPSLHTLLDVVSAAFRARGHNIDDAEWDAWKDESGHWVAQLQWQTGRSANSAHWQFQQDAHGGTVSSLDDAAKALIDPDFGRRGLSAVPKEEPADPPKPELASVPPVEEPVHAVVDDGTDVDNAADAPESETQAPPPAPAETGKDDAAGLPKQSKSKRGAASKKPEMPSWEDVLLGVRSSGH